MLQGLLFPSWILWDWGCQLLEPSFCMESLQNGRQLANQFQNHPCSSEMPHCRPSHWEWYPPYSQHSVITGTPSYEKDKILTQLSFHTWSQLRQNYVNCPKSQDMDSGLRIGPFDSTSTADKIQHRTPKATNKNRHMVIWETSKWHKQISQSVACFVSTGTWVLITRTHGGKKLA